MLKIAYIIPNIETGGTEKHLLNLVKKIDKTRFSAIVITTAGGGSLYNEFKEIVPVYILGGEKERARPSPPLNPLIHINAILNIAKILKEEKVDIAHCYLPAANSLGPIAAKITGVKFIIISKRSLTNYKKGHPLINKLENIGNLFSDKILTNSIAVKKEVEQKEKFWKNKTEVIYNGVEIHPLWNDEKKRNFKELNGFNPNSIYAICVSNFFAYKGHEELIRAASIIKEEFPQIEYLLLGRDAGNLNYIQKLAKELKVADKIHFMGEIKNIWDFLQISDIFIHPSHQEGFSNAILEAMSCALPVIACDVGGNPEAIIHNETGKLIPAKNPEILASAIKELVQNETKRKEMGQKGRERIIKNFSVDLMIKNMEKFYIKYARK